MANEKERPEDAAAPGSDESRARALLENGSIGKGDCCSDAAIASCVEPAAPNVSCGNVVNCGWHVHTCEREEPIDHSYLCPVHPEGFEEDGRWWCGAACYYEAKCEDTEHALAEARQQRDEAVRERDRVIRDTARWVQKDGSRCWCWDPNRLEADRHEPKCAGLRRIAARAQAQRGEGESDD